MQDQASFSITLSIESRLDQIRLLRAALSGVLAHLQVAEADIYDLELAVTEVITNSLEHGYHGATDQRVEIRVEVCGSEVQIEAIDHAPPFPEEELYRLEEDAPSLEDATEEWPMRGHGLQIVRQIVDSIDLHSDADGNCFTLRKHVSLAEGKGPG